MTERFVYHMTVRQIEQRIAKRWLRGVGKDAEFEDNSEGWYLHFREHSASMFLGPDRPNIEPGQRIKLTVEAL